MYHAARAALGLGALLATTSAAAEPLFPASQYGALDLMLPQSIVHLESVLGGHESFEKISEYAATDRIRLLARPVGRLDIELSVGGVSTCTASLLPGGYIITNHHCIPGEGTHGTVTKASVLMGYLEEGNAAGTERFSVETRPVETSAELDYSIVKVIGTDPSTRWGSIRLEARDPVPGESLLIVHHPAGRPQHVTRGGCRAKTTGPVSGNDILHKCDTLGGSSGSPIFSDSTGMVVALHYAGSLSPGGDQYNSGKRMAAIVAQSRLIPQIGATSEAPISTVPVAPTPAVGPVATPPAADLVARIRALPGGGSDAWDDAVRKVIVPAYDQNGSGTLDFASEVDAIPCEVWAAIDAGVRVEWPMGLYTTYGFTGGASWEGDGLGIESAVGWDAGKRLVVCGLTNSDGSTATVAPASPTPAPRQTPQPTPAAPTPSYPSPASSGDAVPALRHLPAEEWDDEALAALVGAYDANRSGNIDTIGEVKSIPCEAWKIIDGKVRAEWNHPMDVIYGFKPDLIWVGGLIGIDERARADAHTALVGCGLGAATAEARTSASTADIQQAFEALMKVPFDDGYNPSARAILVRAFDTDASGAIQTQAELGAIDCRIWRALDQSFRARFNGTGVGQIQGFAPGFIWVGSLGIDATLREPAWAALKGCGLAR